MLFMALDCSRCATARVAFEVTTISVTDRNATDSGTWWLFDAAGPCSHCRQISVATFKGASLHRPETSSGKGSLTDICEFQGYRSEFFLVDQAPKPQEPDVPEHLPEAIERPFLEGEKAFSLGLWGPAAASYRKAVERGIKPLITHEEPKRMLGPRIGQLEQSKLLPPAMLDWIRVIKDDGNFALHDDDSDFDRREQIEPAREFAFTLLTYLYTLPAKVRIARGLPPFETPDETDLL